MGNVDSTYGDHTYDDRTHDDRTYDNPVSDFLNRSFHEPIHPTHSHAERSADQNYRHKHHSTPIADNFNSLDQVYTSAFNINILNFLNNTDHNDDVLLYLYYNIFVLLANLEHYNLALYNQRKMT